MALPKVALPTSSVEIGGETVEYRSLSRSEVLKIQAFAGREDEAEDFIVACGTGVSIEEAHEWRESIDAMTAGPLIDGIILLSGLVDADPKEEPKKGKLKAIS
jgi:hypothetical protein